MIWLSLSLGDFENFFLKPYLINSDKISQLATLLPTNCRLPSKPGIHLLAYDDHAIKLLSTNLDVHNHIAFIVIQKEQTHLLTDKIFQSVHCFILKDVGVILSSNCSPNSEIILEQFAKWVPYLIIKENDRIYGQ